MSGYVRVYRSLRDKGYYRDSEYVHLWVHLLMAAQYQESEYLCNGKIETLKPGQLLTGRNAIARETGIHRSKVERILKTFEIEQQIEQQTTNKFRIITILNWSAYQVCEQQTEQPVSNKRATSEHIQEGKERKKNNNKPPISPLPEWIPQETWDAFLEMRRSIKAPVTPKATTIIIGKLDTMRKAGQDPVAVINQSIERSWRGIFPVQEGGNGTGQRGSGSGYGKPGAATVLPASVQRDIDAINALPVSETASSDLKRYYPERNSRE